MSRFKKYALLCLVLILTFTLVGCSDDEDLSGEYSISGIVVDENEEAIDNVDISADVGGVKKSVKTNSEGAYQINDLPADNYSLTFSKEGYADAIRSGSLSDDLTIDITLNSVETELADAKELVDDLTDSGIKMSQSVRTQMPVVESNFKEEVGPYLEEVGSEMISMGFLLEDSLDNLDGIIEEMIEEDTWEIDIEGYEATIKLTNPLNIIELDEYGELKSIDLREGEFSYVGNHEGLRWNLSFNLDSSNWEEIDLEEVKLILPVDPKISLEGTLNTDELGEVSFTNTLNVDLINENRVEFEGEFNSKEFNLYGKFSLDFYNFDYETLDIELSKIEFEGVMATDLISLDGDVKIEFKEGEELPDLIEFSGAYTYDDNSLKMELDGLLSININLSNDYIGGSIRFEGNWKENDMEMATLIIELKRDGLEEYAVNLYYLFDSEKYIDLQLDIANDQFSLEGVTDKGLKIYFDIDEGTKDGDKIGEITSPSGDIYAEIFSSYANLVDVRFKDGNVQSLFY